eukprot:11306699-Prorocentrum_lima.AAC.1
MFRKIPNTQETHGKTTSQGSREQKRLARCQEAGTHSKTRSQDARERKRPARCEGEETPRTLTFQFAHMH